ncbi:MAG: hypothetical protein U1F21_11575 [Sphaerotilus natans]
MVGLSATQTLFNRQNMLTIDKAWRALDPRRGRPEQCRAGPDAAGGIQAHFDVLIAQDALDRPRLQRLPSARKWVSAKRNFEVGTATITDTREAQARFDLATAQEIAADNELRTRRPGARKKWVGRADLKPLGLKPATAAAARRGHRVLGREDRTEPERAQGPSGP